MWKGSEQISISFPLLLLPFPANSLPYCAAGTPKPRPVSQEECGEGMGGSDTGDSVSASKTDARRNPG